MNKKIYEVFDLTFNADFSINPYTDLIFYAEISGNNCNKTVHGFYNGDNNFVLRLSFEEAGEYNYTIFSNIDALNGISEKITIDDKKANKGPIVLNNKNKKRLFYRDNSHYNLLSFECDWLFALNYNEPDTKITKLAKTLFNYKFNHVIMNVYAYDISWDDPQWLHDDNIIDEHDKSAKKEIYPFLGDNENPDFTAINVTFFKNLDRIINTFCEHNIVMHLMIYVWNKNVSWPLANSVSDNMYFDYVIKRYSAFPNIVWDISKEALSYGRCDDEYIKNRISRLKNIDSYKRLITVHDYSFCNRNPECVDIISVQNWNVDIYGATNKTTIAHENKVVHNVEHGGYEKGDYELFVGNYADAKVCLKRCYEIMFAGAYSSYYWQPISWSILMMPWEAKKEPAFVYYKIMMDFFSKYKYENLSCNVKNSLQSAGRLIASDDNKTTLIYVPKENNAITIFGNALSGKGCTYRFFNTITGEYTAKTSYTLNNFKQFKNPFDDDSIFIIELI